MSRLSFVVGSGRRRHRQRRKLFVYLQLLLFSGDGRKRENVTPCLILKKCELTWFLSLFIYDKKERRPMKTKGKKQRIPNAMTNSLSADTRQDARDLRVRS